MMTTSAPLSAADRNLLFGILALQMDFINRDALVSAMSAWVLNKSKSIGEILHEQGALASDTFALLEALVQKHLALHDGDIGKSLAAIAPGDSLPTELRAIPDSAVQASLVQYATILSSVNDPSATRPSLGHTSALSSPTDPSATLATSVGHPSGVC